MAKGKYADWLTDDGLLRIKGWAREGLTDDQIASNIGVRRETLYDWIKKFPNISDALKSGKAPVDIEVENALLKNALGYTVKVKKPIKMTEVKQKQGEGRIERDYIEYVEEEVVVPANTTAQIFWLKNRRPDRWRDIKAIDVEKANVNLAGEIKATVEHKPIDLSKLTDEELEAYEKANAAMLRLSENGEQETES